MQFLNASFLSSAFFLSQPGKFFYFETGGLRFTYNRRKAEHSPTPVIPSSVSTRINKFCDNALFRRNPNGCMGMESL
jgi:hypothetical protein